MKLARNLVIALAFLVLLYGGAYWSLFRDSVRSNLGWGKLVAYDPGDWHHKFFAPAGEIDGRLNVDRRVREGLRGHWINAETGDFVTVSGNDTFAFQLGEYRFSGKATINRQIGAYKAEFQHGSLTCRFWFSLGTSSIGGITRVDGSATIHTPPGPLSEPKYYHTLLTRAPSPVP